MTITTLFPQWTAKMYPAKVGRDHLGLGSVSSDQILPALVPGINVLTFHPRYHSFYAFLLDEFWHQELPHNSAAWRAFFRPRDFIFCLGAYLCDRTEHGEMRNIVGGQKTAAQAQSRLDSYPTTFPYIESDLGGYGLYYRSVMIELELIYPGGPGFPYPLDLPSEAGQRLAAAFRTAVQNTTYYLHYFAQDPDRIPRTVIEQYIQHACLCQLQTPSAPDRPLLQQIFLQGGHPTRAAERCRTLRLLLDITSQTNGHGIDADRFRQLLYFRATADGAHYVPSHSVQEIYDRWRLYQAREFYAFALNTLWSHLCDWGLDQQGDVRPVPLARLWAHVEANLDFAHLARLLDIEPPRLHATSDFMTLLAWLQRMVQAEGLAFDDGCRMDAPLHEHKLYWLVRNAPGDATAAVAGMITMLALLYLRFGHPEVWRQPAWHISRMGADGRLSLDGFVHELQRRLRSGPLTIADVATWLYTDYIILQHQLVAASKLPDNTFRFQREGNRLRFFNLEARADFLDSRYDALATTIHELGFCGDPRHVEHPLTAEGQRLLEVGDRP